MTKSGFLSNCSGVESFRLNIHGLKSVKKTGRKGVRLAIHGRHALAVLWAHAGSVLSEVEVKALFRESRRLGRPLHASALQEAATLGTPLARRSRVRHSNPD
jgi:hypothetical protein